MRTHLHLSRSATLAVTLGLLAACSSETVAQPPAAPVDWRSFEVRQAPDSGAEILSEKERALAAAYATALGSPGFTQLTPLLDEEAHFASPGMDEVHARTPVIRAHERLLGAFDDRKVAISRVWRTPSEQTVEWTMSGTQARDWYGVVASHKTVVFNALSLLWTKDDGSITDIHTYIDVALVKAQLGSGPKELLALPVPAMSTGSVLVLEAKGDPAEKAGVSVVRASLDALETNDEAKYVAAMSDDVNVYTLERLQPAQGKNEAKAYYKAMHKAIGQLDTTVDNAWGVGPFAIVEYSVAGEQLGPFGWIPAQRDKVIRFMVVDVVEIKDGKLAVVWRYDNPSQIVVPPAR
jgi:ketosteroid isomerase-like protein